MARLGAGDFFGEMALLTGENRAADVVALSDVVAIEIAKDALQPVLRDHPGPGGGDLVEGHGAPREPGLAAERVNEEAHHTVLSRIRAWFGL